MSAPNLQPKPSSLSGSGTHAPATLGPLRVAFKSFDSKMASREKLFRAATEFASQLGRDQLINITHSEDRDNIAVCIWYWTNEIERFEAKGAAKPVERKPAEPVKYVGSGEGPGQRFITKPEPARRTMPGTMVPEPNEGIRDDNPGDDDSP